MSWTMIEKYNYEEEFEFSYNEWGKQITTKVKNSVIKSVEFVHGSFPAIIGCKIIKIVPEGEIPKVRLELSVSSLNATDIPELNLRQSITNPKPNLKRGTVKKTLNGKEERFNLWIEYQECTQYFEYTKDTNQNAWQNYTGKDEDRKLYTSLSRFFSDRCGLLKTSKNLNLCSFAEIEGQLQNCNALILSNEELFFADINTRTLNKIELTQNNNKEFNLLKGRFVYSYALANDDELKLISSLTDTDFCVFNNSEIDFEICSLYHQRKNEKDLSNIVLSYAERNDIEAAIEKAEQFQNDYYFNPIWQLALKLHEMALQKDSGVDFQIVYNAYSSISEQNPYFKKAQQKIVELIMSIKCSFDDEYFEEKFKSLLQSNGEQKLVDLLFYQLCGNSGLTLAPPITNVKTDINTLCAAAFEMRKLHIEIEQLRKENSKLQEIKKQMDKLQGPEKGDNLGKLEKESTSLNSNLFFYNTTTTSDNAPTPSTSLENGGNTGAIGMDNSV